MATKIHPTKALLIKTTVELLDTKLPDEISVEDFVHLLTIVGKYKGFSPFNNSQDKYGTYEVISVEPVSSPGNE